MKIEKTTKAKQYLGYNTLRMSYPAIILVSYSMANDGFSIDVQGATTEVALSSNGRIINMTGLLSSYDAGVMITDVVILGKGAKTLHHSVKGVPIRLNQHKL